MGDWRQNQSGEWYWPLHPNRQQDHLRVWRVPGHMIEGNPPEGWMGALCVDGEYLDVCRTHAYPDAEMAKREVWGVARLYLGVLLSELGE